MVQMQKTFNDVRDYIGEFDGSSEMMVQLLTELAGFCDQLIQNSAKRWRYRNKFAALRDEFMIDVDTLCGRSKIIYLPVIIALRDGGDDFINERLDRFYDLCDDADIMLD